MGHYYKLFYYFVVRCSASASLLPHGRPANLSAGLQVREEALRHDASVSAAEDAAAVLKHQVTLLQNELDASEQREAHAIRQAEAHMQLDMRQQQLKYERQIQVNAVSMSLSTGQCVCLCIVWLIASMGVCWLRLPKGGLPALYTFPAYPVKCGRLDTQSSA